MNVLATAGAAALLTALACSIFAAGAAIVGQRRGSVALLQAARRAIVVVAGFTSLAIVTLAYALLTDDFSLAYVVSVSSTDMLTHMKLAALYSSQAGSLLFWTWAMSLLLAALAVVTLPRIPWAAGHATAASGLLLAAFLAGSVFLASPFEAAAFGFADGQGLNPLLVDPGMLIHPPMLLLGLASTSVPFVLAAAALASGRTGAGWMRAVRQWALLSWLVLSAGNLLGAWWAYHVLGWGGYWGWDPVENSAILPLLPLTAFLHTMMVQERRGMLQLWNFVLVLSTFVLAVFGTFNVRSGLVASVHSFAQSNIGPYFLALLGLTVVASVGLLAWRAPRMRAGADIESLASRETAMILNGYTFTALTLVILGGTLFPVFSELFEGARITVGPPFYNDVVGPLLVAVLALIVFGTVVPWRGASRGTLARRFRVPLAATAAIVGALALAGVRDLAALATLSLAAAIALVTLREFAAGTRAARRARNTGWATSLLSLFARDQRRYGGYLVHIGVAVLAVGVIGSNVYQEHGRAALAPGESMTIGGYTLSYAGLVRREGTGNGVEDEIVAPLTVTRDGAVIGRVEPGHRFFTNFPEQPVTSIGLRSTVREDLYVFLAGWDDTQVAEFQAFVNPLVAWIWIGGAIYIAGGAIVFAPSRSPARESSRLAAGATARV